MFAEVNGTELYFEIIGPKPNASDVRIGDKPTLVALHGGPGFDHMTLRPFFDRFADIAQVLYLDHRGNGRSIGSGPDSWTLAQWGDDVKALCDRLGIARPIVMGQSFGGFVAQSYATRHPEHPAALILSSTAARMDFTDRASRIELAGGAVARAVAERMWSEADEPSIIEYGRIVLPLYATPADDLTFSKQVIRRFDVAAHFYRAPHGEIHSMDWRSSLARVLCPTLVLSGGRGDLITPPEAAREIVAAMSPGLAQYRCLEHCRHGVYRDDPAAAEQIVRAFVADILWQ